MVLVVVVGAVRRGPGRRRDGRMGRAGTATGEPQQQRWRSRRLFQKTIEGFDCKINVRALGAALRHSLLHGPGYFEKTN